MRPKANPHLYHKPICHSDCTLNQTWAVGVTVVVKASSGHRLAPKQCVTVEVVAELFQEAQDVSDTADCRKGQGVLLLVKVG